MNEAQKLLSRLGIPHNSEPYKRTANGAKNYSWTKKGPGRKYQRKTRLQISLENIKKTDFGAGPV